MSDIRQLEEPQPSSAWADIALSRRGDGEAYARVITRYQHLVARLLRRVASNRQTLEELTHDVFVDAYFALPSFRGDHGEASFISWLSRMAVRRGYRYLKDRASARNVVELPDLAAKEEVPDSSEISLERVLCQLAPRDRIVITLLYLDEKSVAQAAELLGWSQTMVKVQAFRARGKLKEIMKSLAPQNCRGFNHE